jgi:predicted nucleotidyltransferase
MRPKNRHLGGLLSNGVSLLRKPTCRINSPIVSALTFQSLSQSPRHWLFRGLSGSHAYGTALPESDRDTRGIFVLPRDAFYGLRPVAQLHDDRNDHVFYELGRAIELLSKSNPNMLELLALPEDCVLYAHPLFAELRPEWFLSRQCLPTFGGYAATQIKKARGLNKKIRNPQPRERRSVLDFCYVTVGGGTQPVSTWLAAQHRTAERCGLVALEHIRDTYALYYDADGTLGYRGLVSSAAEANDLHLSAVPRGAQPLTYLHFNRDGYQVHCRDHREYWNWVASRNEARYRNTVAHGKQYDAKNMMHTFRLLYTARDIAREGILRVRRPERTELLAIRRGEFSYEELVDRAERLLTGLEKDFAQSSLPDQPDQPAIEAALVRIRRAWYATDGT